MAGLLQVGIGNAGPEPVAGPGINNATIQDQDGEDKKAVAVADALGSVLHGRFIEWRDARREKEDEWMEAFRAYIGKYDETVETGFGKRSKVFVHLTRTKTLAAYSRIIDLMLGHGRHWDIEPTPEPDLTTERMEEMYAVAEQVQPGVDLSDEEIEKAAVILADRSCDKMRTRIEDQLAESNYEHLFKSASLEMCIFGSGALKGPVIKRKVSQTWGRGPDGSWNMADEEETVPGLESPSIFDLYPDPHATSIDDCTGIFERHVITAQWFRDLASHPGFDSDAIEEVLAAAPSGNHEDYLHETERRRLNGTSNVTVTNQRYDVMEYWGQVKGSELSAAGMVISAEQMNMEFQANVWFCGNRTIKANLNPLKPERLPYQICPYERVPNSIWGIGVPMQMRDSQIVINASVRATLDNLGISSGPMMEVNVSLLADGEDPRDLHPWRIFLRTGGDAAHPMLRVFHTNNITNELNNVTEQFRRFADEETSLPSYTHGEAGQGLNKTASGMSMLMGAANVAPITYLFPDFGLLNTCMRPSGRAVNTPVVMLTSPTNFGLKHSARASIRCDDVNTMRPENRNASSASHGYSCLNRSSALPPSLGFSS